MKTSAIIISIGILGFMLGFLISEKYQNKDMAKEIELITKNSFVFETSQKADILTQIYEKYEKSGKAGEDHLKKILFINYESLLFTNNLKFVDKKEFLLGKIEKVKTILVNDPISKCVSVEKEIILECYKKSIYGK